MFNFLKSILYSKQKLDINVEDNEFSTFMINRWISMYSLDMCYFVNKTTNFRLDKVFGNSKDDIYKFMFNIIPQNRYKNISYIKKSSKTDKKTKKNEDDNISDYANNMEISQREIKWYNEILKKAN